MIPVMFANPELASMIDIPNCLPLNDLRGEPIYERNQIVAWHELRWGDAEFNQFLPADSWRRLIDGIITFIPFIVHQPTGSSTSYAKIRHKRLGRVWVEFDGRDGPKWREVRSWIET